MSSGMVMIVKPGQVVKMCDWSPNDHSIATWYRSCAPRMGMGFDTPRTVIEDENDRSCAGLWKEGAGLGVRHSWLSGLDWLLLSFVNEGCGELCRCDAVDPGELGLDWTSRNC